MRSKAIYPRTKGCFSKEEDRSNDDRSENRGENDGSEVLGTLHFEGSREKDVGRNCTMGLTPGERLCNVGGNTNHNCTLSLASKEEVDNRPPIQEEEGRPTNDLGLSLLKEANSNKGPGICTGDIGLSPNLEEERRFTPGKEKGKQKGRLVPAASDGSKNQGDLGSSSTIGDK
ncbi:hypothetical protein Ancab_032853 [Ancistrocladus abbreviatus]